jgi:hypothetical protein
MHRNLENNKPYLRLIILHFLIGVVIYLISGISKLIFLASVSYFVFKILTASSSQKFKHVLLASAYIVGAETFFRMTGGSFFYESSKYLVILFMIMGVFFKGISSKAYPYFIYLILLVPSILVASTVLGYDLKFRSSIAFVLSGPVCLGMSALFLYDKKISREDLLEVLFYLALPIISMTTYLFLYSPSLKDVVSGTASNFAASGGFGPNQVSTLLGLGAFVFTVRFFIKSPNLFLKIINGLLIGVIFFRAIVTFSRGGVLTAFIMIIAFLGILYLRSSMRQRQNIMLTLVLFTFLGVGTWVMSSTQTSGMIDKRYANEDAAGRKKEDISTGRSDLFFNELEGFTNNPFLGVGASGMKQYRLENDEGIIASHNEVSRLLSEHGLLGVIILMILIFKPISYWFENRSNIFFFAFLCFWFATINHSAMRIAAPGFIYALSLLNIVHDKRPLHRQSITS